MNCGQNKELVTVQMCSSYDCEVGSYMYVNDVRVLSPH